MLARPAIRTSILFGATAAVVAAALVQPRIPQDPAYHRFADTRTVLGIPNGLDVVSNLGFLLAGVFGLAAMRRAPSVRGRAMASERWPYAALFAGTLLTAFGSAYYHLAPDNGRLVWDRLPMTIGFMGLVAALIGERVSLPASRVLLLPLLALGAGSVVYWHWSELRGAGDLRPYGVVQFGSLLLVVLMLGLFPSRRADAGYFWAGLGLYAAAKVFELFDRQVFAAGHIVSGHTLKHLAAAAAIGCIAVMFRKRALK